MNIIPLLVNVQYRFAVFAALMAELLMFGWSPVVVLAVRSPAVVTLANETVTGV